MTGVVTSLSADRICVGRPVATGNCFTGVSSKDRRNLKIGDCVWVVYQPGDGSVAGCATQVTAVSGAAAARECP